MGTFHAVQLFSVFLTWSRPRLVEAEMEPKEREVKQYARDMDSNTCSDKEIGHAACLQMPPTVLPEKSEQH